MSDESSFLADIQNEGSPAFTEGEKETPTSSPEETKPETESPSAQGDEKAEESSTNTVSEENMPFHEHPRWKEVYGQAKLVPELQEKLSDLEAYKQQVEERFTKLSGNQNPSAPEWIQEGFGDNPALQGKFSQYEKDLEDRIVQRVYSEQEKARSQAEKAQSSAQEFVNRSMQELEDEGLKFDRNELLKVAVEYRPSDDSGNIDLRKAYRILEATKEDTSERSKARKEIAAGTTAKSKAESAPRDYVTSNDLRNKSWSRLID